MNKQSPFRIILNLMLIVIVVISVVATGFVSIKGYRANRIPEIYSDKEITKAVKDAYPDFESNKSDKWDINTQLAEDNKSFTADVSIDRVNGLHNVQYGVQLTFILKNGSWKVEDRPSEIAIVNSEWLFEDTEWAVTAENGTIYEVSFGTDLEAKLSIQETEEADSSEKEPVNVLAEESEDEDVVEDEDVSKTLEAEEENDTDEDSDARSKETSADVNEQNKVFTCVLVESEDRTFAQGTFETALGESIMLTVTEDSVKLQLSNEGGELILEKK